MTKCIAPPRGNWIGQVYYLELDDKILRSVYWNGVNWVNSWGDPACSCDACSPPQISPPSAIEGNQRGQRLVMDLGGGKCRVVHWDGQEWQDGDGNKVCHCDACSPMPIEKAQIDGMTIVEGSLMDMERRIKYDDKEGCWRVIFNGKVTTDKLKSSGEAHALLSEFIRKSKEPKY